MDIKTPATIPDTVGKHCASFGILLLHDIISLQTTGFATGIDMRHIGQFIIASLILILRVQLDPVPVGKNNPYQFIAATLRLFKVIKCSRVLHPPLTASKMTRLAKELVRRQQFNRPLRHNVINRPMFLLCTITTGKLAHHAATHGN